MTEEEAARDTPRRWGVMEDGRFRAIPKPPMLMGAYGPPPFRVARPDGVELDIIEEPEQPA